MWPFSKKKEKQQQQTVATSAAALTSSTPEPAPEDWTERIELAVACGYGSEDDVRREIREDVARDDDDEAVVARWMAVLEERLAEQRRREESWTEVTDNDRLTRAFARLEAEGIVAVEDAGYTMSDGWCVVGERADERPGATGAVFFHRQDVERGVDDGGLLLAFGGLTEGADDAAAVVIARRVVAVLREAGLEVGWSGDASKRILVGPFPWRRRRTTTAPA